MIHISIEGMDGVGKTTTCRLLAEKLGYKFVEKNLRFLFDENDGYDNYFRIRDKGANTLEHIVRGQAHSTVIHRLKQNAFNGGNGVLGGNGAH